MSDLEKTWAGIVGGCKELGTPLFNPKGNIGKMCHNYDYHREGTRRASSFPCAGAGGDRR
jgi:hypothetical protein